MSLSDASCRSAPATPVAEPTVADAMTTRVPLEDPLGWIAAVDRSCRLDSHHGRVPELVTVGLWRSRRRRLAKEAGLEMLAIQHDLIASSRRCRCWTTPVLSGDQAVGYLEHHLHPLEPPAEIANLSEAHPDRGLRTAYCSRIRCRLAEHHHRSRGRCLPTPRPPRLYSTPHQPTMWVLTQPPASTCSTPRAARPRA